MDGSSRRRWTTLVACFVLVGLSAGVVADQKRGEPVALAPYVGYWEGSGQLSVGYTSYPARVALSISPDAILMEVAQNQVRMRATLKVVGGGEGGVLQLEPTSTEFRGAAVDINRITVTLQEPRVGIGGARGLLVERARPETRRSRNPFARRAPATREADQASEGIVFARASLSLPKTVHGERAYGGSGVVTYEDWRTVGGAGASGLSDSRTEEANARVAGDIAALQKSGWRCLSQIDRTVPAGNSFTLTSDGAPGAARLYLIYARVPAPRLVYSVSNNPASYLRMQGMEGRNYPTVVSERGWTSTLAFTTQPVPGSLERLSVPVPISIFVFGSTFGDYGDGCRLSEFGLEDVRQFDSYARLLGRIALSVGSEAVRRQAIASDSALLQAFAAAVRNASVEAALRELVPQASDGAVAYYSRWAVLLLSNDVSTMSIFRETAREYLLQQVERQAPEFAGEARLLDAVVDLYFQGDLNRRAAPPPRR